MSDFSSSHPLPSPPLSPGPWGSRTQPHSCSELWTSELGEELPIQSPLRSEAAIGGEAAARPGAQTTLAAGWLADLQPACCPKAVPPCSKPSLSISQLGCSPQLYLPSSHIVWASPVPSNPPKSPFPPSPGPSPHPSPASTRTTCVFMAAEKLVKPASWSHQSLPMARF